MLFSLFDCPLFHCHIVFDVFISFNCDIAYHGPLCFTVLICFSIAHAHQGFREMNCCITGQSCFSKMFICYRFNHSTKTQCCFSAQQERVKRSFKHRALKLVTIFDTMLRCYFEPSVTKVHPIRGSPFSRLYYSPLDNVV